MGEIASGWYSVITGIIMVWITSVMAWANSNKKDMAKEMTLIRKEHNDAEIASNFRIDKIGVEVHGRMDKMDADNGEHFQAVHAALTKHLEEDAERHRLHSIAMAQVQLNQEHTHVRLVDIKGEIKKSAEDGAREVSKMFEILLDEFRSTKKS